MTMGPSCGTPAAAPKKVNPKKQANRIALLAQMKG